MTGLVVCDDIFLPTKILDCFFEIENDPTEEILNQTSQLVWLPSAEVKAYFAHCQAKVEKSFTDNIWRETW